MADKSEEPPQKLPASVYLVGALTQCALGMHAPFLATYVLDMGANLAELGAFRSVGKLHLRFFNLFGEQLLIRWGMRRNLLHSAL